MSDEKYPSREWLSRQLVESNAWCDKLQKQLHAAQAAIAKKDGLIERIRNQAPTKEINRLCEAALSVDIDLSAVERHDVDLGI